VLNGAANGITANVMSAGMNDSIGARMKSGIYAASGYVSSFMMFFSPSAAGCNRPPYPVRFGPMRS
jgi:hypothetical protein